MHLPLTSQGVEMKLYKFSDLPVHMPQGWVSVKTEKKYIAVSEGAANQYFTLTEQEFEGCELRRGSFWCTDKTPYGLSGSRPRGVNDERCVHSLFRFATGHEDSADSLKYCEFGEVGSYDEVKQLSENTFAIFTDAEADGRLRVTCEATNFEASYPKSNLYVVYLPPGCTAKTKEILVEPQESLREYVETNTIHIPSLASLGQLLIDTLEEPEAHISTAALGNNSALNYLLEHAKDVGNVEVHSAIGTIVNHVALAILIVFVLGMLIYCKCIRSTRERAERKAAYTGGNSLNDLA